MLGDIVELLKIFAMTVNNISSDCWAITEDFIWRLII